MKLYKIDWFDLMVGHGFLAVGMLMLGGALEIHPSWKTFAVGILTIGVFSGMFIENAIQRVKVENDATNRG